LLIGVLALAFDIQTVKTETSVFESNPYSNVIATYGRGYLENVSGLLVLHVKGKPYEMGYQHGFLLRDRIKRYIQYFVYDIYIGQLGYSYDYMISRLQAMLPHMPSEYIELIQGIADGADVNYTELLFTNTIPPIRLGDQNTLCSAFAVFGNATVNHHLYFGKNLDGILTPEPWDLVTICEPDNGSAFVNLQLLNVLLMTQEMVGIGVGTDMKNLVN
jgi:hypothetical protein